MYFKLPNFIKRLVPELRWNLRDDNAIFLTFDDGPTPEVTPRVLDILDKFGAKATFFCLGKNVDLYPEIYQQILSRGHAVGNHTYSHQKGWGMATGRYLEDVDLAGGMIRSNLFRPPYGRVTPAQIRRLSDRYHIIMWDILSRDYSQVVSPRSCVHNVTRHLRPGSIVVFHDSVKASRNMYYALPRVLEEIARRGFTTKVIEL